MVVPTRILLNFNAIVDNDGNTFTAFLNSQK